MGPKIIFGRRIERMSGVLSLDMPHAKTQRGLPDLPAVGEWSERLDRLRVLELAAKSRP